MKIAIASDHGGYALKNELLPYITELGHEFRDFGCYSTDSMDYPDIAFPAAEAVASGEFDRGILIRQHNDSNMLAMGGRIIGIETAKAIVKTWLCTEFAGGRHERRIGKISDYECR